MNTPIVIIIMGSASDEPHAGKIAEAVKRYGIESELRVGSAHKTPAPLLEMLAAYEKEKRPRVYVTVAGRSNALSGFVDGAVSVPVIACPPPSESYGGADIWSSLRMPSGIAAAFVMEPANAALLAAKMLEWADPSIGRKIEAERQARMEEIGQSDKALKARKGRA